MVTIFVTSIQKKKDKQNNVLAININIYIIYKIGLSDN